MRLDPYNAFLHRVEGEGDWRVAAKDVIDVAGMPTTAASKMLYRVPDAMPSASRGCARPERRSSGS